MTTPLFRKVLIELIGLEEPIEMWWTEQFIEEFPEMVYRDTLNQTLRVKNTPSSMIEFDSNIFINMQITNEIDLLLTGHCLHLTQFHKYCCNSQLPIPKSTFNDDFEFPITLICLTNNSGDSPIKSDFSNYTNLDYLMDRKISLIEHLSNPKEYSLVNFEPSMFLFAEYLKL